MARMRVNEFKEDLKHLTFKNDSSGISRSNPIRLDWEKKSDLETIENNTKVYSNVGLALCKGDVIEFHHVFEADLTSQGNSSKRIYLDVRVNGQPKAFQLETFINPINIERIRNNSIAIEVKKAYETSYVPNGDIFGFLKKFMGQSVKITYSAHSVPIEVRVSRRMLKMKPWSDNPSLSLNDLVIIKSNLMILEDPNMNV